MNSTRTGSKPNDYLEYSDGYDLLTLGEWQQAKDFGYLIQGEDGEGYWIVDGKNSEIPVHFPMPSTATGVIWFSK